MSGKIDYRKLLFKYMNYVGSIEGIDFVYREPLPEWLFREGESLKPHELTIEDYRQLIVISEMGYVYED